MFLERFSNYLQFEKRFSAHTTGAYLNDLQQFHTHLAQTNLDFTDAGHQDVRSWMLSLMDDRSAAKTISRKLSALRTFYRFLNRENLTDKNPMLLVKAPKIPKRLPSVVESDKLDQLLDGAGQDEQPYFTDDFEGKRNRLIIEMLFGTGIRLAELLTLTEKDLDLQQKQIRVLGKRRKQRIVPLHASLLTILPEYLSDLKNQGFDNPESHLILTGSGKPAYPKLVYRVVHEYLDKVSTSQKKSPHVLRHSFATSLLNKGADLNAIKELLGHASLAATQVYTHNSVERLKSIYKQAHPRA
jgi:integrase/recombinase XerC